jgi:hypothetical protein
MELSAVGRFGQGEEEQRTYAEITEEAEAHTEERKKKEGAAMLRPCNEERF